MLYLNLKRAALEPEANDMLKGMGAQDISGPDSFSEVSSSYTIYSCCTFTLYVIVCCIILLFRFISHTKMVIYDS
jgi:hypothetical protein